MDRKKAKGKARVKGSGGGKSNSLLGQEDEDEERYLSPTNDSSRSGQRASHYSSLSRKGVRRKPLSTTALQRQLPQSSEAGTFSQWAIEPSSSHSPRPRPPRITREVESWMVWSGRLRPPMPFDLPWADEWPEAVEYYMQNTPDFTGLGLFKHTQYPADYRLSALSNPISFTIQVLFAERAKQPPDLLRILSLKFWVLTAINDSIQDQNQHIDITTVASINKTALYDLLFEPEEISAHEAHIDGFFRLLPLVGGLEGLRKSFATAYNLAYWSDSLSSFLLDLPKRLNPRNMHSWISDDIHTLRLAVQPTDSNLPEQRLRHLMTVIYGSPLEVLFQRMEQLQLLVEGYVSSDESSAAGTKERFLVWASELETNILTLTTLDNGLNSPEFSGTDQRNFLDVFNLALRVTLLLVARFRQVVSEGQDPSSPDTSVDHTLQSLLLLLLSPELKVRSQEVLWWAVFVAGSLTPQSNSFHRQSMLECFVKMCRAVNVWTWQGAETLLLRIFHVPALQNKPCLQFWDDAQCFAAIMQGQSNVELLDEISQ